MTMEDGRFVPDTVDAVIEVLMDNARDVFGDDLNDDEKAVIRLFYEPVARLIVETQWDLRTVLDSAQLDFAQGTALSLLTALIGVRRKDAVKATGTVTFSRASAASVDHTIPRGTIVQTEDVDPIRFETTESAILEAGQTSISGVPIQAVVGGVLSNVGANTLVVMTDPPTGIEEVTNPQQTDGGINEESDADLRERAKQELSDGMRGTARAIKNELLKMDDVTSVSLFINDSPSTDGDGIPSHHTECVVTGGTDQEVGQTICDTKGAGDGTHGGSHGTLVEVDADIGTGQTLPIQFSRPTIAQVYAEIELVTDETYGGDESVRDALVRYIGGTISSGDSYNGELRTGDDVVYTKVLSAIHSIPGVEDIPTLNIGLTDPPTGTTNVAIADTEIPTADATDGSITITQV